CPRRSQRLAAYSGGDSNEPPIRLDCPSARGYGNKSFLRSILSVIDPITGIRKEGNYGERQSRRWYQPTANPRMHDVGRHCRSMEGFGRHAAVVEPARPGASGGCHRADEANDSGDREKYDVTLLA